MSQTHFGDFGDVERETGSGAMDRILNMDDAVGELTDFEVMDVWVRGTFFRQLQRADSRLLATEDSDRLETQLSECHPGIFKQIAVEFAGRDSDLSQSLTWEDDRENVRTLFERWTKDDVGDPVTGARERIKTSLRGCGMPAINIQRNRVKHHVKER